MGVSVDAAPVIILSGGIFSSRNTVRDLQRSRRNYLDADCRWFRYVKERQQQQVNGCLILDKSTSTTTHTTCKWPGKTCISLTDDFLHKK